MYTTMLPLIILGLPLFVQGTETCSSKYTQPNPIAAHYPDAPSGVLNGTVAIIPIPYALARQIVPSEYPILQRAYEELIPELGPGQYPALLELLIDHDVRVGNSSTPVVPDFQHANIAFPFVDRLNDGYTSMLYGNTELFTASNAAAIAGTVMYGFDVLPATFEPCGEAYAAVPGCKSTYFNATSIDNVNGSMDGIFAPLTWGEKSPWRFEVMRNLSGQPKFSNNKQYCDNFIRLYNTSLTQPPYAPVPVKGTVSAIAPAFAKTTTFTNVYGYKFATAFVEYNYLPCSELQGY